MTDFFATLGVPRRPEIDLEVLKAHYHELVAQLHPDKPGGDATKFKTVSEGYAALQSPVLRLRHLMALEEISAGEMVGNPDLFLLAGSAIQSARAMCEKCNAAQSAIGRAGLVGEQKRVLLQLDDALAKCTEEEERLRTRLKLLNTLWPGQSSEELVGLVADWTFLDRWLDQLKELKFQLQTL